MSKKVLITQSNYIPWKGYFDSIALCDVFVVYDDMQFTKRDWRNRNLLKTPNGLKWLTIPVEVKGKFHQKINDTRIADLNWAKQHWQILEQNYKKAAGFKEHGEWIKELYYNCNHSFLTDVNMHFITEIMSRLGIQTEIVFSSQFVLHEEKTQRLVNICSELNGTEYYSGPAAKSYMDEQLFNEKSISVNYFDYSGYLEYNQLYNDFEHGVSILDLFLNVDLNPSKYMKFNL